MNGVGSWGGREDDEEYGTSYFQRAGLRAYIIDIQTLLLLHDSNETTSTEVEQMRVIQ